MKILITGKNGYIGTNLRAYLTERGYDAECISVRDTDKIHINADVVIHCAAKVHKNEKKYTLDDYMKVNCTLTEIIAKKAKENGAKQFIFLSTMSVYGIESGEITEETPPSPVTLYGKSKIAAENKIMPLSSPDFKIVIIRPPIVYGRFSPGNYARLSKLVKKTFIFPYIHNKKSMIYIENLCEFIKLCIDNNASGKYLIQNKDYVSVMEMVKAIKKRGIYYSPLLGKIISKIKKGIFNKVFGDLFYEKTVYFDNKYQITDFEESIKRTEKGVVAK